jgi:hypothetical protein
MSISLFGLFWIVAISMAVGSFLTMRWESRLFLEVNDCLNKATEALKVAREQLKADMAVFEQYESLIGLLLSLSKSDGSQS